MNQHKGLGQSFKILAAKAKDLYICSKNLMPDIMIMTIICSSIWFSFKFGQLPETVGPALMIVLVLPPV